MKKNNLFLIFGATLILISLMALSPFQLAPFSDVKLSPEQIRTINSINAEMQTITEKYVSLTAISDPGDILAYRWLAMAKDYVEQGFLPSPQGSDASVINSAMASIVAKYGSLTSITDPGDLLAYRWLAMAKLYQH